MVDLDPNKAGFAKVKVKQQQLSSILKRSITITDLACLYNSFPPAAERVDISTLAFKAKYNKKSHETQNQTNILIKGSITDQCVCLISIATSIPFFCSRSRFYFEGTLEI